MPNGINLISPSIRDFLLNRNLILSDTITNNGLSSLASGLGYPAQVSSSPEAVLASTDILTNGDLYRDLNLINNPYASTHGDDMVDIQSRPLAGNLPPNTSQTEYPAIVGSATPNSRFNNVSNTAREQVVRNQYQPNVGDQETVDIQYRAGKYTPKSGGYVDNHNNLNVGGPSTTALDYIGGVLNGNSLGVDGQPNFDIRSSLAGRALGANGAINDTPLGIIGGQQLLISLANKAAFNAQRETLGQLNLSPISLLSGDDFIVPNYSITVGKQTGDKILDTALNIFGFEAPTSYLFDVASSIYASENPVSTKSRIMSQVPNTGKGQVISLFTNLNANKYRLGITDERTGNNGVNPNLYIFSDGDGGIIDMINSPTITDDQGNIIGTIADSVNNPISPSNYKLGAMVRESGFVGLKGIKIGDSDFIWSDDKLNNEPNSVAASINASLPEGFQGNEASQRPATYFTDQKTMLGRTQALFNSGKMKILVAGHGAKADYSSEVETLVKVGGSEFISKGSGVISKAAIDGTAGDEPTNIFCRTWSSLDKYNKVEDLQKHSGLGYNFGLRNRNTPELSVLDNNGFVRIAPNIGDDAMKGNTPVNIKRFMFSLENLAWSGDDYFNLPASERGPGDPMTGTKGRIMWFPPYGLNFTDTTSVNWDTHAFIGRGEPVYTYNNSERSGTLSFKVIIDHASYMNELRGNSSNDLFASIASGCYEFDLEKIKNLTKGEQNEVEKANVVKPNEIQDTKQEPPAPFTVYFANDVATMDKPSGYEAYGDENNPGIGCGITVSEGYTSKLGQQYEDRLSYGSNKPYLDPNFISKLKEELKTKCPACRINLGGWASTDGNPTDNQRLSDDRAASVKKWFLVNIISEDNAPEKRFLKVKGNGATGCPKDSAPVDALCKKKARKVDVTFTYDPEINEANVKAQAKKNEAESARKDLNNKIKSRFFNEALYFQKLEQDNKVVFDTLGEKIKYFHPAFHSITPEGFNSRLNFLQQCTRQGATRAGDGPNNLAFGMAPVLILRIGDFYHTKVVMENLDIDFDSGTGVQWDLNPEGVGVQPMIANVTMSFKFIGGQSLNGPINKLQNAVSFNFFANTEVYDPRADYIKINTDTKKGAEYKNDLDKGNLASILGVIKVDDTINDSITNDQTDVANTANAEQESPGASPTSGATTSSTPKITGIELVSKNAWGDSDTAYTVSILLKQEGIYNTGGGTISQILTDDQLKAFINKGVKVSLDPTNGGARVEEVVKATADTPKRFEDFFGIGYHMGTNEGMGTRIQFLAKGEYVLSISYNGQKVASKNVII